MVVLNKIYTRTGDAGTTALGTGERVPKHSPRIAAYGTVDETNAADRRGAPPRARRACRRRRHAGPHPERSVRSRRRPARAGARSEAGTRERLRVSDAQVKRLEDEIDAMNAELQPLAVVRAAGRLAGRGGAARGAHGVPARRARMVELAGRAQTST